MAAGDRDGQPIAHAARILTRAAYCPGRGEDPVRGMQGKKEVKSKDFQQETGKGLEGELMGLAWGVACFIGKVSPQAPIGGQ